jgi:sulfite reductase alpha subunit-like flavoprotein
VKADGIAYNEAPMGDLPAVGSARVFRGVASNFLCFHSESAAAVLAVHKSAFRLPADKKCPIIMVGAGTGVAPFRGFLRELAKTGSQRKSVLFFGCRRRDEDFIYSDEFEEAQKSGALTHLVTAFSREQAHKVYVQDRVKEEAKLIRTLFDEGAVIYICGATAMGQSVKDALAPIVGDTEALRGTRIIEELWG